MSFKDMAQKFLLGLSIETAGPKIIKEFMAPYTPEAFGEMVKAKQFPYIESAYLEQLQGNKNLILGISVMQFAEMLGEARPDLIKILLGMGDEGGVYIHLLHGHIMDLILHPEKAAQQASLKQGVGKDMVKAVCESCHQDWPVPREDFAKIEKCPFCGAKDSPPTP